jgi:TRAP-type C4-dicarboxylate transport system permease large subunit
LRHLLDEIKGTMIDTAVIMLIIAFTSAFGVVMIRGQVPDALAGFLSHLTSDPTMLLMLFTALWMVVGCFMAETPAILILTPILLPTAESFGIDPVHFGIVMALALTIGLLTPPVGMVLYALIPVTELPFERLAILAIPYILLSLVVVFLIIIFPDLVLWLPRIVMGEG